MAAINKDMVAAGRNAPFSENEIRKVLGYEEEAELDDMPGEGDPDDDDLDPLPGRDEPQQQRPAAQPAANEGGGLLQRMARAVRGVTTNADEPRTISPNPEADQTMRLARQYLAEGRTVELSLRVEAAPAAPTIQVAAPNVTVEAPRITVEAPNVAVTNNVQPTDVTVQVAAPVVTVEAQLPDVNVTLDMPPRTSTTIVEYNEAGDVSRTHTVEGAKTPR
jgi:phage baseplate assembly protein gpV